MSLFISCTKKEEKEELINWARKGDMPTGRCSLGVVEVNGKIYAIGGEGDNQISNIVEEYDPETDTWIKKADMPTKRKTLGTAEVNGKIYAIGGYNFKDEELTTVEEYDPETDTWTKKADMPTKRDGLGVIEANGKIYAIGGYNNEEGYLSIVEEYDPKTDTWAKKADMFSKRDGFGVVKADGKIYTVGGYYDKKGGNLNIVEEYDPETDTWTEKADMPTKRSKLGVAEVNGKIYAVGGAKLSHKTAFDIVEEYDPKTNTWIEKENMPIQRKELGVVETGGKIYVIGGYTGTGVVSYVEVYTLTNTLGKITYKITESSFTEKDLKGTINILKERLTELGYKGVNLHMENGNEIKLEIPNVKVAELEDVSKLLAKKGEVKFFDIKGNIIITDKNIKNIEVVSEKETLKPGIVLEFDKEGKEILSKTTTKIAKAEKEKDKILAIVIDDEIISTPWVTEPIIDGKVVMLGYERNEIKRLVSLMKSKTLPISIEKINTAIEE